MVLWISNIFNSAKDIYSGIIRYEQVGVLGWQDVRQRYRRSSLGPFWLTISMAILIATIGLVFGQIYRMPLQEFLPYLTCGMILWGFLTTTVSESCHSFIAAEGIIKQLPIPLFVHVQRVIWRNMIIFAHNLIIYPLVLVVFPIKLNTNLLLILPGIFVLIINLAWVSLVLGIVCARYRDLPQMVNSVLQILIFLTPIMWMPQSLSERMGFYLVQLNPIYHMLEIIRSPLLGVSPAGISWIVSIGIAFIGWGFALQMYTRYKSRIVFWL